MQQDTKHLLRGALFLTAVNTLLISPAQRVSDAYRQLP